MCKRMIGSVVRTALAIVVVALAAPGSPTRAQDLSGKQDMSRKQDMPGESDDARYSFSRVDEGYLRLDGRTGQVSLCTRRPAGWACQAVADDRTAFEAEIARLQGENAALKKEMLARKLPLPGTVKPDAPAAKPEEPHLALPSDTDLNRMMTFLDKMWRRLVDMIGTWRKDISNRS
jgi:hypothetical protein